MEGNGNTQKKKQKKTSVVPSRGYRPPKTGKRKNPDHKIIYTSEYIKDHVWNRGERYEARGRGGGEVLDPCLGYRGAA